MPSSTLLIHIGKISFEVPPYIGINLDEATRKVALNIVDRKERKQREMWGTCWFARTRDENWQFPGTTRANLNNHILGVSEGHTAVLRLVGVGFRATIEPSAITKQPEYPGQQFVSLKLGYSHPIEMPIPLGMKASVPQPTRILLEGPVKEVVNQFAAEIRLWRVPEPYKGKGIFVNGETIKMKAKKIKWSISLNWKTDWMIQVTDKESLVILPNVSHITERSQTDFILRL